MSMGIQSGWAGSGNFTREGTSQSQSAGSFIPEYSQSPFLAQIAQVSAQMAQAMHQWGQEQYARTSAITDQVVDQALATSAAAGGIANNAMERYYGVFQPLENQLVQDANTYASDTRIAQEMGSAAAGTRQAFDQAQDNATRELESFGIDPSAGRYDDLNRAYETAGGAAGAAAARQARLATEDRGRAMRSEAIKVGQQYPGQALSALDTGIRGLNTAQNATTQNIAAGRALMNLPNEYLNTAMSLKYPPLGTGPSSSQSAAMGSGQGGVGMGGVVSKPSSQEKEEGAGRPSGGGGRPSGGGAGRPSGGGSGGGARSADAPDSWRPPEPATPIKGGIQHLGGWDPEMSINTGAAFDGLGSWDPLGGTDFSYLDQDPGADWYGGWDANGYVGDWGYDAAGNEADPFTDWGWDGSFDASGNQADPFTDWGYDDYGVDAAGNTADPYSDWNSDGYDTGGGWYDGGDYGWDDSGGGGYYDDYSASGGDWYGGYDAGSYDTGGYDGGWDDSYGDMGYAEGGPVPSGFRGGNVPPGGTPGGMVPKQASPSGGRMQDDVNAKLTPDEFVVPRDVALWKGQEFFQNLIKKSREARMGAPAKGRPGPDTGGQPAFKSQPRR